MVSRRLSCGCHRYDDLRNYTNERSIWLANLRDRIEEQWQAWELEQLDGAARISRDTPLEQASSAPVTLPLATVLPEWLSSPLACPACTTIGHA